MREREVMRGVMSDEDLRNVAMCGGVAFSFALRRTKRVDGQRVISDSMD